MSERDRETERQRGGEGGLDRARYEPAVLRRGASLCAAEQHFEFGSCGRRFGTSHPTHRHILRPVALRATPCTGVARWRAHWFGLSWRGLEPLADGSSLGRKPCRSARCEPLQSAACRENCSGRTRCTLVLPGGAHRRPSKLAFSPSACSQVGSRLHQPRLFLRLVVLLGARQH